jgi:hypothetical protein
MLPEMRADGQHSRELLLAQMRWAAARRINRLGDV